MQPDDPMEVEAQIAEMLLSMRGNSPQEKYAALIGKFPNVTDDQLLVGAGIAVQILESAADEYEQQSAAIAQEIERRRNLQ